MRPELERLQLIEEQVLNGPAALPADEWRLRQLLDGELDADAQVQQRLYRGMRQAGQRELRRELAAIHSRLYGAGRHRFGWPLRWLQSWLRPLLP